VNAHSFGTDLNMQQGMDTCFDDLEKVIQEALKDHPNPINAGICH
jgi:hypothetical protein